MLQSIKPMARVRAAMASTSVPRASASLGLALLGGLSPFAGAWASAASHDAAPLCEAHIQGQPGKRFDLADIRVPASCKQFTVHLVHTGKKPWQAAGHNWVLARTSDIDAVIEEGQREGPDRAWVPRADSRVIAATQMLSGGEHASVTFPVARLKAGEPYTYYCSFPTHAGVMRGRLEVVGE